MRTRLLVRSICCFLVAVVMAVTLAANMAGGDENSVNDALLKGEAAERVGTLIVRLMGWEYQDGFLFRLVPPVAPPGFEAVGLVRDGVFYVFAYDLAAPALRLLEGVADAAVNDAKLWIVQDEHEVSVWSQYPYRASEQVVTYRWEAGSLVEIDRTTGDPTREALDRQRQLIQEGRFEEVERPVDLEILYPQFYQEYTEMGVFALQEAHRQAIEEYRAGNPQRSRDIMAWAFDYYFNADPYMRREGWTVADTTSADFFSPERVIDYYLPPVESLSGQTIAWYLNDYAFFLAESGDDAAAEPFLHRVIELDRDRTVAYINLGDVTWNLGKYDQARGFYREYLRRLGENVSRVPDRVYQRLGD